MKTILRFLLLAALIVGLSPLPAFAADITVASGVWQAAGPGAPRRMAQTCSFVNTATTVTDVATVSVGASNAKLARLIVASTNCADCDIAIVQTAGTGATDLLYSNTTMAASTVNGVAYTCYMNVIDVSVSTASTIYVRLTNNDPSSDDDTTVTLVWEEAQ